MAEPDFSALRSQVEDATRPPEFAHVTARARRARLRDRLAAGGAVLTTLTVFLPIVVVATRGGRSPEAAAGGLPGEPGRVASAPVPASPRPISVALRAVAGTSVNHLFAAIDVCTTDTGPRHCSLQVTALPLDGAGRHQSPLVIGQLRDGPADGLSQVRLVALSPRSLMLTGVVGSGTRGYVRVSTSGGAADLPTTRSLLAADPGDRPVQLRDRGDMYVVRQRDDRIGLLARQPPVHLPILAAGVAPEYGWWVVGSDPVTSETTVAVTHNRGESWTTARLGARMGGGSPTLVTRDGGTAYLFTRAGDGTITVARTVNRGQTWTTLPAALAWPEATVAGWDVPAADRRFGAWMRPDGSVVVWLDGSPVATFLETTDGGATFTPTPGPDAPVDTLDDGYVAYDQQAFYSVDGKGWRLVPMPAYVPVT
ncbi:MAG TPA: hypothetical protein VK453_19580 [Micromonosporaceae bacterium]|nr:hypothetical protein [Micromonosporaceae bacterium]